MSSIQEIPNNASALDAGVSGRGDAADRIQMMKATRAALTAIREAAESRGAAQEPEPKALGELNFRVLDIDKNGALSVSEMQRMKPPLPPRDQGPSLAERMLEARALLGVEDAAGPERDAAGLFLERLKVVKAA